MIDSSSFEAKVAAFEKQQKFLADSIESQKKQFLKNKEKTYSTELTPFPFDPNGLSSKKWKEIGLSDYQVGMIKKYESKGGYFNEADDLAKIYSISDEEFEILKHYIKIKKKDSNPDISYKTTEIVPFPFDPNKVSVDDLTTMGMSEKLINSIINYRTKGGIFKIREDVAKIYGLSENDYLKLKPFIQLPDIIEPHKKNIKPTLSININTADTLDLQQIPGIGPSFARRIVKYRSMLGGYFKVEQLKEVYGMDSLRYAGITDYIKVNGTDIVKLNVNKITIKELIKHPYIEFYLAKSIISFRKESGGLTSIDELKNIRLMYDELFFKIKPYLHIEESNTKQ